jgi:hypothetical protein
MTAADRRPGFRQQAENAGSLALAYASTGDAERAGDRARIAAYWAIRFRDPQHEHAPTVRVASVARLALALGASS